MAKLTGLCMRCRDENKKPTKQDFNDDSLNVTKNEKGRYQARGTCAKCDGNMFKFLSQTDAEALKV